MHYLTFGAAKCQSKVLDNSNNTACPLILVPLELIYGLDTAIPALPVATATINPDTPLLAGNPVLTKCIPDSLYKPQVAIMATT